MWPIGKVGMQAETLDVQDEVVASDAADKRTTSGGCCCRG